MEKRKGESRKEAGGREEAGQGRKTLISSNSHTSRAYFLATWLEGQRSLALVYFPSETQQMQTGYGRGFLWHCISSRAAGNVS